MVAPQEVDSFTARPQRWPSLEKNKQTKTETVKEVVQVESSLAKKVSSSSSAFPAVALGFTILGEIFASVT